MMKLFCILIVVLVMLIYTKCHIYNYTLKKSLLIHNFKMYNYNNKYSAQTIQPMGVEES